MPSTIEDTTFSGTLFGEYSQVGCIIFYPKTNISNTFNQKATTQQIMLLKKVRVIIFLNVDYHASWSGGPIP